MNLEKSLCLNTSQNSLHLPPIKLVQRSWTNGHHSQHAMPMYHQPVCISIWSIGRNVLIQQDPNGTNRNQNHDSHQTKLTSDVGIPCHLRVVLCTSPHPLPLYQSSNRKWRRPNHRHFQVPPSLPPRSRNLKHWPHCKSYSTNMLHNSKSTQCTIGWPTCHSTT